MKFDFMSGSTIEHMDGLRAINSSMLMGNLVDSLEKADYHNAFLRVQAPGRPAGDVYIDRFILSNIPIFPQLGNVVLMVEDPWLSTPRPMDTVSNFGSKIGKFLMSGSSFDHLLYIRSKSNECRPVISSINYGSSGILITLGKSIGSLELFQ